MGRMVTDVLFRERQHGSTRRRARSQTTPRASAKPGVAARDRASGIGSPTFVDRDLTFGRYFCQSLAVEINPADRVAALIWRPRDMVGSLDLVI